MDTSLKTLPTAARAPASGRAWRTVVDAVEHMLTTGEVRPGGRLPPERELAARLGVGRSSVREALRVLEVFGLVRTATGSGPTAGATVVASPAGGMGELLRLQLAAEGFEVADVVATRILLEEWVSGALADVTEPPLADATAQLELMDDEALSPDDFLAADARFHLALAHASGNAVVAATMAGLRASIEDYVRRGAERLRPRWEAERTRLQQEHHALLAAITAGDAPAARQIVRSHITDYYARTGLAGHPTRRN